ncbi:MAG TPA: hypothetical protein VFC69_00040, partial [Dysgonamonadaceae bacterium]|nr:hypothetical protein [Dysgonamonadaceae bacterium]
YLNTIFCSLLLYLFNRKLLYKGKQFVLFSTFVEVDIDSPLSFDTEQKLMLQTARADLQSVCCEAKEVKRSFSLKRHTLTK